LLADFTLKLCVELLLSAADRILYVANAQLFLQLFADFVFDESACRRSGKLC
jgi:hypothetical protein